MPLLLVRVGELSPVIEWRPARTYRGSGGFFYVVDSTAVQASRPREAWNSAKALASALISGSARRDLPSFGPVLRSWPAPLPAGFTGILAGPVPPELWPLTPTRFCPELGIPEPKSSGLIRPLPRMVPTPWLTARVALVCLVRLTKKVLSCPVFGLTRTVMVLLVSPGLKVS